MVRDLLKGLSSNETLNANPKIAEARKRVNPDELRKKTIDFLCAATGGPDQYEGRTMKESHVHLDVTAGEWEAMTEQFVLVLATHQVPQKETNELLALVESLRADIVKE